ncbi:MAG: hypothetical protein H7A46_17080 [Verrucomicrobiales bacterium]|nr:hypothetical protein [Verrucomicrobiales bacterium]
MGENRLTEPSNCCLPLGEQVYLEVRKDYNASELEASGRYDKWILTLSGGALGISITFVEKIAKNPNPDTLWLLGVAWVFLVLALLSALWSLVTSQLGIRETRDELDLAQSEGRAPSLTYPKRFTRITGILNWVSLGVFTLGVSCLCAFSFANLRALHHEQERGIQHETTQTTNITATATKD